jgi:hypothetical protein
MMSGTLVGMIVGVGNTVVRVLVGGGEAVAVGGGEGGGA